MPYTIMELSALSISEAKDFSILNFSILPLTFSMF